MPVPFYADWQFWTWFVALLALVFSQLPPVPVMLRGTRLRIDIPSRIIVAHTVGNPNIGNIIILKNNGRQTVRITSMTMTVRRENRVVADMPFTTYFETAASKATTLLTPFDLKSDESWSHSMIFSRMLDRAEEQQLRAATSALRADLERKVAAKPMDDKSLVEVDAPLVHPFMAKFQQLFIWQPGEYEAQLSIVTEPSAATTTKKFRFTLFESDTADLRNQTDEYKFGGSGIAWTSPHHSPVFVPTAPIA